MYPWRSSSSCWRSRNFWNSPRDLAFSRSLVNSLRGTANTRYSIISVYVKMLDLQKEDNLTHWAHPEPDWARKMSPAELEEQNRTRAIHSLWHHSPKIQGVGQNQWILFGCKLHTEFKTIFSHWPSRALWSSFPWWYTGILSAWQSRCYQSAWSRCWDLPSRADIPCRWWCSGVHSQPEHKGQAVHPLLWHRYLWGKFNSLM